jgi:hypothetical protein
MHGNMNINNIYIVNRSQRSAYVKPGTQNISIYLDKDLFQTP